MPIEPSAVGATPDPVERSWTSKDALLYALGVGAGATDPTGFELPFTTENSRDVTQRVLPTFGVIIGGGGPMSKIGSFNPAMLVHGEQTVQLHKELPVEGTVRNVGRIAAIYDKGSAAVVVLESEGVDVATGEPLLSTRSSLFIRGEGGFGGDRGPSGGGAEAPDRDPDHVVTYATREDQALLYRLSGDRNPLHSDPEFAKLAGFPKPILHGLCTYGVTGRALLHALCDSDPSRFRSMTGRFSKPVFPGEALTVKIWRTGDGEATFQTVNPAGEGVLGPGVVTFA